MLCVVGNHEDMLARLMRDPSLEDDFRLRFGSGLSVAMNVLTAPQHAYLAALPTRSVIEIDGKSLLLCHGTPWDTSEGPNPESDPSTFLRCAESGTDYVVMGHTHCQMAELVGSTLLINSGPWGSHGGDHPGPPGRCLLTGAYEHHIEEYDREPVVVRARETYSHLPFLWEILGYS